MKKLSKQCISIFLTVVIVISILPMSAFAANYSTNYWDHSEPSRTLSYSYKSQGDEVKWLQCAINNLVTYGDNSSIPSYLNTSKLDVDGVFGPATTTAVTAFQRKYGLTASGHFNTASFNKMKSVLHPAPGPDPVPSYNSVPHNVTEGTYYIRNKLSNKYLDVKGGSSYNGAELVQFPFHGDANQQFQITYENGAYKIYTKIGGNRRCLDLWSSSDADTNGTDLKLYDASSSYKEQNFRFESLGDGSYHIGSCCSNGNKVLEVTNSSYDDCATVQIWQRDNSRINDDWYLEPVNDHNTSVNKVRQAQMNVKSRKQYDSIDDAALDFIMAYDGMSVAQNREYGAGIVPVGNNKYTFNHIVWGPVRNSVNGELGDDNWREINSYDAVAYVHTHGQMWYGEKANLVFSPADMDAVDKDDYDLKYAYLGNAYGDVYKYVKGETNTRHSYDEFRANSNKYSGHYITNYSKCVTDYWTDTSFSQNNGAGIYRLR